MAKKVAINKQREMELEQNLMELEHRLHDSTGLLGDMVDLCDEQSEEIKLLKGNLSSCHKKIDHMQSIMTSVKILMRSMPGIKNVPA